VACVVVYIGREKVGLTARLGKHESALLKLCFSLVLQMRFLINILLQFYYNPLAKLSISVQSTETFSV
jgi:hypothetical protein